MKNDRPLILFIDLFCGAGGVTTGAVRARIGKYQPVKVIACVNHDPLAIESHKANHPGSIHFNQDIRTLPLDQLISITEYYRSKYPKAILVLWCSLECTNYSKAKGGMPRDPDSRSLPYEMPRYINALDPDYFYYENVEEFMAWGPLDENGKPKSMKKGRDYLRWIEQIKSMGFNYSKRILNSANYGAHTKRKRLFGIFTRNGMPICWPEATHAEIVEEGLFDKLQPWKPVRECLDFSKEGKSIFRRKRPLVENTLKRIYAGLQKYVLDAESFLIKYYSNGDNVESIDQPSCTITTKDRFSLVQTVWIDKQFRSKYNHQSIAKPAGSILTNDKHCLVQAHHFIDRQFGSGDHNHHSVDEPAGSITSVPKMNLITVKVPFLMKYYSNGDHVKDIDSPADTITTIDHHCLVSVSAPWILSYNYNNNGHSVHDPSPTLLASRHHHYLAQARFGVDREHLEEMESDTPTMTKIKKACKELGIIDIYTRMLNVDELKRIQGFGDRYHLEGNKTDQKKFIGNSVPPQVVKAMMEALALNI